MKERDRSISIAKGIAISLMVLGHTSLRGLFCTWLYSCRMPLFFFVSGYLFKEKHISDPVGYIKNKIKGLYIPFVKWTLLFLAFHNVLYSCHIYKTEYSYTKFIDMVIRAFTLRGSEQLLGGYWFLIEALLSSLIAFGVIYCTDGISKKYMNVNKWLVYASTVAVLVITAYLLGENKLFFKIRSVTLLATAFFFSGYLFKNLFKKVSVLISMVIIFSTFMIAAFFNEGLSIDVHGWKTFLFFIMATFNVISIISICNVISKWRWTKMFDFIGTYTFIILTWHFLSFKIVSLFIIWRDGLSIYKLSDFPGINSGNSYDWIIYLIFGISLPLMGMIAMRKAKLYVKSILNLSCIVREQE